MTNRAESTTLVEPVRCLECGRSWLDLSERWRIYLLSGESPPEPLTYCPDCARREFD